MGRFLMISIDARCDCQACKDRTEDVYHMVGRCYNCSAKDILITYRKGDGSGAVDCPVCGNWHSVHADRLATTEEADEKGIENLFAQAT